MTTRNNRFALLASVTVRAFGEQAGWKKDADGKLALDGEGNPIWINTAGAEASVKGDTITNLNGEARQHRTRAEAAEAELKKYEVNGKRIDPVTAIKAVDDIGKIDSKKLIDAGEVDKVREQMRAEFAGQITELNNKTGEQSQTINNMRIDRAFDGSEFVRDRIAVPRDMFRDSFGKNVKVGEDGKLEYYGRDGNRLWSKKNSGEYAQGDEAFELMIAEHPQKDTILRAQQGNGTGNNGNGGQQGGKGRTIKRSEFSAMAPLEQKNAAEAMGKGELVIADD